MQTIYNNVIMSDIQKWNITTWKYTNELRGSRDMAFKQMSYILKNAPEIRLVYLIKIAASKCTYLEKFLSDLHFEIPLP